MEDSLILTDAKARMEAGLPFRDDDPKLQELHFTNLHRLWKLNQCDPLDKEKRRQLLKEAVPNAGEGFYAQSPFHCDYGFNIHTGKNVYINYNCVILDVGRVTIGSGVMIGPNVAIYAVGHPIHPEPRVQGKLDYGREVVIGDNVWIGGNSVLNPGVHIGENTVIGSGSVVTRDIPANVVAFGNPCRVYRAITEAEKAATAEGKPLIPAAPINPDHYSAKSG